MGKVRNILFVMADQLRADYLSCAGHPYLKTPVIDALAARGVRFERAYVQSPVCGPSRMSFYTGRYVASHGAIWNTVPLRIGEPTLGDHLRPLGVRTALVGKTHMAADYPGMARLGVKPDSVEGVFASECGFEPWERDDGLHPDATARADLAYNRYLRERGYAEPNPWHSAANSGTRGDGARVSGWSMRNSPLAARVAEEDSETAYITRRAMDFIDDAGETPWCLHLSYIKPHWPYIAPAPYHAMYGPEHVIPVVRGNAERETPHPVFAAYQHMPEAISFSRDEVRRAVIPVYMGLIRQIDDHLGRLFTFMAERGRLDDTMIVMTSDHGDYLGDHWLGEKELFHEQSAHIPLIVVDPDPAADGTRGKVARDFVEAIDLAPTFVEAVGGTVPSHILEGRSLLPTLRNGVAPPPREAAFSELDYALRPARIELGVAPDAARIWMVRTARHKFVHYQGFRPQLFDLAEDPEELFDRGDDPSLEGVRREMRDRLGEWALGLKSRITLSNQDVERRRGRPPSGIIIGEW